MLNIRVIWEDYNTSVFQVNALNITEAIQQIINTLPKSQKQVIHVMQDQGYNVGY
jgi:hypothetical protein